MKVTDRMVNAAIAEFNFPGDLVAFDGFSEEDKTQMRRAIEKAIEVGE